MRIKQLKLTGFKSFVEPAELRIESGLTGIVGPNGCGKSNLLEAIRWVMGEGSAKSLRGAGMDDVIFAGTASRPSRDFAEVTIRADRDPADIRPGFAANDDDPELEVTRRIERGAGSAYRANGRDVRAKDVALIFADAATGAHSPALVSQGRIGSIIAAKPQERRQMLEEAAGISGLHVRRKDAEQKLRAAETNLNRLATILADMDARAGQLRRQAKQAERYRRLTTEITQAEARLIFIRWKEAKAAADAAKAEAQTASLAVDAAAVTQRELAEQQQSAISKLADARAAAMMTRDAANDLSNKNIQLCAARDRIVQRQADLSAQAARMADDGAREGKLTHDAADALKRLQDENGRLAGEIKETEDARPALIRSAENAERQSRESEVILAKAMAEQARAEAEQRVADAALSGASARMERAQRDTSRLADEQAALGDANALLAAKHEAEQRVAALQSQITELSAAIAEAESKRENLTIQRDAAQSALASAKAEHAALESEHRALERALASAQTQSGGDKAIDRVKVAPGYERAFAAALGDDVNAVIGGDAGRRWISINLRHPEFISPAVTDVPGSISPNQTEGEADKWMLKQVQHDGVYKLADHVEAPAELALRLVMTLVAETDDGQVLAPGQRLVTLDGKLRRWDGYAAEDDGAATAQQLIRANRLSELADLLPSAERTVIDGEETAQVLLDQITTAQGLYRSRSVQAQTAETDLRLALREADKAEDAITRLNAATQALASRRAAADQELQASNAEVTAAQSARSALPKSDHHSALVAKLAEEGEAVRRNLVQAQADLSTLDQRISQQRERRAVAAAEIRGWQERAGEAERRIAEMNTRAAEIASELESMAGQPDILAAEIAAVEASRGGIADKLAALQLAEQESEAALKTLEASLAIAAEALSSARELRAGAQARAENQELRRVEMGRVSGERFECPPPVLPEKLGFDENDIGDAPTESARLDRLQMDRERIGPVNLIAADELTELETEQEKGVAESAELTEAINRLRGSIGSLNREGRQRLLAAFEAVDGHFRRLFTTLFNGGQAHLELIDSDDPLEAGLEIMAQPPGKKLASLTLLSGGEQALTAVALIFGLFLTNPAPICVLDEVDAPLDDANIERFCDLLDVMQRETDTRYLIVTHNAVTMSRMHRLFGVTMVEQGVSRLVSVDLGGAEELLAAE
jgi:chromosome segregation protein